eukprot:SAG22_NODE_5640_length_979_cov_0.912500_1_plen_39_part_10
MMSPDFIWFHPGFLNGRLMEPIYLPLSIGLFNLSCKAPG